MGEEHDRCPFYGIFILRAVGSYAHAATIVRAKLTGAWVKKQDRERA